MGTVKKLKYIKLSKNKKVSITASTIRQLYKQTKILENDKTVIDRAYLNMRSTTWYIAKLNMGITQNNLDLLKTNTQLSYFILGLYLGFIAIVIYSLFGT